MASFVTVAQTPAAAATTIMTESKSPVARVVVMGATGGVGKCVVAELLANSQVTSVLVLVRKTGSFMPHTKLTERVFDFESKEELKDNPFTGAQVGICCLGSTIKAAGSQERFWVTKAATLAKEAGVTHWSYCSSVGANARSSTFYLKCKGQIEEDFKAMKFARLSIFRPSLLIAKRPTFRCGECCGVFLVKYLCGLCICMCCTQYDGIRVETVARAMVTDACVAGNSNEVGVRMFDGSEQCEKMAARANQADASTALLK